MNPPPPGFIKFIFDAAVKLDKVVLVLVCNDHIHCSSILHAWIAFDLPIEFKILFSLKSLIPLMTHRLKLEVLCGQIFFIE